MKTVCEFLRNWSGDANVERREIETNSKIENILRPAAERKPHVVLLDREGAALKYAERVRRGRGYVLRGVQDLEQLRAALDDPLVELVILDWVLPGGQTAAQALPWCRNKKVHILSAYSSKFRKLQAAGVGVSSKPLADFPALVEALLRGDSPAATV